MKVMNLQASRLDYDACGPAFMPDFWHSFFFLPALGQTVFWASKDTSQAPRHGLDRNLF